MEEAKLASQPASISFKDLSQWDIRPSDGVHVLKTGLPVPTENGELLIDAATVASKILYTKKGRRPVEFRLIMGWPGSQPGELTIFEVKPEEDKWPSDKGKLSGTAWGGNYVSAESAYEFLENSDDWSPVPQEPNQSEDPRNSLIIQIKDAVPGISSELAEVLSYFPVEAALFIRTQKYAQSVEGVETGSMIYTIVHHKKEGHGLNGHNAYRDGDIESLGFEGFTGEYIVRLMSEVGNLRGEGRQGEFNYAPNIADIYEIIITVKTPDLKCSREQLMLKKALEVMKFTPDELEMMKSYQESSNSADLLRRKAKDLRDQASDLMTKADAVIAEAKNSVEQIYPRLIKKK